MALKINNKKFKSGLILNDVYCKINGIGGTQDLISVKIIYYMNENARIENKEWLDEKIFNFKPNNEDNSYNIFKQAYDYLKTNDEEFIDSIDVLEDCQSL